METDDRLVESPPAVEELSAPEVEELLGSCEEAAGGEP